MESRKRLKEKIAALEEDVQDKSEEIKLLRARISGERVCTTYCSVCDHGIPARYGFGYTEYICDLNAKCKDFQRK